MMTSKIYLYHQRHKVILLDTSGEFFSRRFRQVYTKNLTAHKGTDNQILIEFVNQDQKRVDLNKKTITDAGIVAGSFVVDQLYEIITVGTTDYTLIGSADNTIGTEFTATGVGSGTGTASAIEYANLQFTCRLISHDGNSLLLEKPLESVNTATGQTKLVLTEQELDLIAPGRVGWSVEQVATGKPYEPVYVDDNAGGRGVMDIVDSIMPSFVASEILTIPAHVGSPYVTSILNTDDTDLHTFQFDMTQFSGDIVAEGAADIDGMWYTIQTESLTLSDLHTFSISGYHPYIRFNITETAGTVDQIQHR